MSGQCCLLERQVKGEKAATGRKRVKGIPTGGRNLGRHSTLKQKGPGETEGLKDNRARSCGA